MVSFIISVRLRSIHDKNFATVTTVTRASNNNITNNGYNNMNCINNIYTNNDYNTNWNNSSYSNNSKKLQKIDNSQQLK